MINQHPEPAVPTLQEILEQLGAKVVKEGDGLFTTRDLYEHMRAGGRKITIDTVSKMVSRGMDDGIVEFVCMVMRTNRVGTTAPRPAYRYVKAKTT